MGTKHADSIRQIVLQIVNQSHVVQNVGENINVLKEQISQLKAQIKDLENLKQDKQMLDDMLAVAMNLSPKLVKQIQREVKSGALEICPSEKPVLKEDTNVKSEKIKKAIDFTKTEEIKQPSEPKKRSKSVDEDIPFHPLPESVKTSASDPVPVLVQVKSLQKVDREMARTLSADKKDVINHMAKVKMGINELPAWLADEGKVDFRHVSNILLEFDYFSVEGYAGYLNYALASYLKDGNSDTLIENMDEISSFIKLVAKEFNA